MQFLFGYGMFADVWAPVSEIVINLSVAITCGSLWGLPGILLGGILSQLLIVGIWKPIYLFRKGFKESIWKYWLGFFKLTLSILAPAVVIYYLILPHVNIVPNSGYINWIIYAMVTVGVYGILTMPLMYMLNSGMRRFVKRFIKI